MDAPISPGATIGRKYLVERVLGEGGMGLVVLATHTALKTKFAVKVMRPAFAASPVAQRRLMEEAQNASRIAGEHVVRVVDADILPDGVAYLAMEYLEGADLSHVIETEGRLLPYDAVDVVLQACDAVIGAHALAIVHRDLKPSNLFVTRRSDGSRLVKVLDFGLSKDHGDVSRPDLTRSLTMLGSPIYMSPEQIRDPRSAGASTDIWALGIVLFESLAGQPPFTGVTHGGLSVAISTDPLPDLHLLAPGTPEPLVGIVRRCLEKRPEDRFPTVLALHDALAAILPYLPRARPAAVIRTGSGTVVSADGFLGETVASGAETRPSAAPRRKLKLLAGGTATVVLAGAALAFVLARPTPPSSASANAPASSGPGSPPVHPAPTASTEPASSGAPSGSSQPSAPSVTPAASATESARTAPRPPARADGFQAAAKPTPADCNPPYTVDEKGHKLFKPQCL